MKKNELTTLLKQVKGFNKPNPKKEQYITPIELALELTKDVKEKHVLDLGAGTGILGIAALLQEAEHVTFIEEDEQAINTLKENLETLNKYIQQEQYTIIQANVKLTDSHADITIMNPPFGTREEHIDKFFLEYALTHTTTVNTLHKTSTKEFVKKRAKALGATIDEEEDLRYTLSHTMKHHTKETQTIEVTRFSFKKV